MQPLHRPRGRPKGTGINDRTKLRDIAMIVASQPHIKPTTAIKMLGEHDPSVIRRLRDKFFSVQDELLQELRTGKGPQPSSGAPQAAPGQGSASAASPVVRLTGETSAAQTSPPVGLAAELAAAVGRAAQRFPDGKSFAAAVPATARGESAPASEHLARISPALAAQALAAASNLNAAADGSTAIDIDRSKLVDLASYNVMLGLAIQATVTAIGHQTRVYEETLRLPPIMALLKQQIAIGEMVMAMTWPAGQARMDTLQPATAAR